MWKRQASCDTYNIAAATKAGAEMLKVDNVTDPLAEGKSADLLVSNGTLKM